MFQVLLRLLCFIAAAIWTISRTIAETGALSVPLVDETGAPRVMPLYSHSFALVIGIDAYDQAKDGWPRLREAVNDAVAVASELERHGFKVVILVDRDVRLASGRREKGRRIDRDALDGAFRDFIREYGFEQNARIVIWYSGHGHTVGKNGYLVPVGAPNPGPPAVTGDRTRLEHDFATRALNMSRFPEYMRDIRSKHVLLIFDSCFAGEGVPRSLPSPAPQPLQFLRGIDGARLTLQSSRAVRHFITSGDAQQVVADDGKFRDLFIRSLQGFQEPDGDNADQNNDGYITGTELGRYINRKVVYYSPLLRQTPQSAKMRDRNFDLGEFVFKVLPPTAAQLLPPTPTIADPLSEMDQGNRKAPPKESQRPSGSAPVLPPPPPEPKNVGTVADAAFLRAMQSELKRLGCYGGEIDGNWGSRSQTAFQAYLRHAKLGAANLPTNELLYGAKRIQSRVCPLVCGSNEHLVDGNCVQKPVPRRVPVFNKPSIPPTPPKPTRTSNCALWMFTGQICTDSRGRTCIQQGAQRMCQ